jgi:Na+-transporting methylmalonyl-CoA/oxaloacetate decarboxylase gamma subunit
MHVESSLALFWAIHEVKKLLIFLGAVFLVLMIVIAALIGYTAFTGNALDKESKAYVDAAVPAIVSSWNEQELLKRASPEFQKATGPADVDRLCRWLRTLGQLQKYEGSQGQATIAVTPQTGKVVSAHYSAKVAFDRGRATIEISLIKRGNAWQIAGFKVNSPALAPQ